MSAARTRPAAEGVETVPIDTCELCGRPGARRYRDLVDSTFGAPGGWDLYGCGPRGCGLLWLNPMPAESALPLLYARYYTHADARAEGVRPVPGPKAVLRRGHAWILAALGVAAQRRAAEAMYLLD